MTEKLNISSQKLYSGANWSWSESLPEYPASSYSLTLILKKGTASAITMQAAATDVFTFTKSAVDTAKIPAGDYNYQVIAQKDGGVIVVESGIISLTALLSADGDPRGYWTRVYEIYKETYLRSAGQEVSEVTIDGKTAKYESREALEKAMEHAEYKARQEQREQAGKSSYQQILVSFQ